MSPSGNSPSTTQSEEFAPLVFVGGPISDPDHMGFLRNIRRGLTMEAAVLQAGFTPAMVFSDFMVVMFTDETLQKVALQRIMRTLLSKSDYVLMLPGWENSPGSVKEVEVARNLGIPIFFALEDLVRSYQESRPV